MTSSNFIKVSLELFNSIIAKLCRIRVMFDELEILRVVPVINSVLARVISVLSIDTEAFSIATHHRFAYSAS